jgi:hypothetical protein
LSLSAGRLSIAAAIFDTPDCCATAIRGVFLTESRAFGRLIIVDENQMIEGNRWPGFADQWLANIAWHSDKQWIADLYLGKTSEIPIRATGSLSGGNKQVGWYQRLSSTAACIDFIANFVPGGPGRISLQPLSLEYGFSKFEITPLFALLDYSSQAFLNQCFY